VAIHAWRTAFGEAATIDGVASGPARWFVAARKKSRDFNAKCGGGALGGRSHLL